MKFLRSPEAVIALILIAAMVLIGLANPAFWSWTNLFSLVKSNIVIGLIALGVMLVMLTGGFDVSGPAFGVAAMYIVVRALVAADYDGVVLPFVAATVIGAALGLMNAVIVHRFKMIPLIVTLGTGSIVRGLLLGVLGTSIVNINKMPDALREFGAANMLTLTTADGRPVGLTAMLIVYAAIAVALHLVLRHTMIGRSVYAYGSSPESAERVGFNTWRTIMFVYVAAGALAGFAGLLQSAMIWQANPRDFVGLELDVIAAVVLGGASIFGGRGSVLGTVLGVFILVMIKNSLILLGVDTTWQRVVVGAMLIAATAISALRDRKAQA